LRGKKRVEPGSDKRKRKRMKGNLEGGLSRKEARRKGLKKREGTKARKGKKQDTDYMDSTSRNES